MNKVLVKDEPVCIKCHLDMEKAICKRFVDAERELVRRYDGGMGKGKGNGDWKWVWEERLRRGELMMVEVGELDRRVGRMAEWRNSS